MIEDLKEDAASQDAKNGTACFWGGGSVEVQSRLAVAC